jgi:hypothetical protein
LVEAPWFGRREATTKSNWAVALACRGRPIGDRSATGTGNACLVHDPVEPAAVLGAVGLLRYCSARHLARIGALMAPLEVRAATVVVAAGARDVPLVLVLGGVARAEGHDGHAIRIGPGAHVGADMLLDGGPAAWTVTAVTGMRLGVIERRNFLALLTHPWVAGWPIRGCTPPRSYVSELSYGLGSAGGERGAGGQGMASTAGRR